MKPLEPLKDADINYVSLQATFLLDLASGKCHSKIHAWVTKFQAEDSLKKMALLSSSYFIKESQLTGEVAQSVSPVIISAWTTVVDRQFKEDRTLHHPVLPGSYPGPDRW